MGVDGAGGSGTLDPVGDRTATKQHNALVPVLPICCPGHPTLDVAASIIVGFLDGWTTSLHDMD